MRNQHFLKDDFRADNEEINPEEIKVGSIVKYWYGRELKSVKVVRTEERGFDGRPAELTFNKKLQALQFKISKEVVWVHISQIENVIRDGE